MYVQKNPDSGSQVQLTVWTLFLLHDGPLQGF